jgi:uncharacterized protein involved in outer membrane biogenesis
MKKLRIVLGIAVGLVVLAVAAVWLLVDPNKYRDTIQAQLEKQLGRKVTLGEMSLGLLPLRVQVASPSIAEDVRISQNTPFVQAEKLDVRIGLLPLLSGNVAVRALVLDRPAVELIRTKDGSWNFATIGPAASPQEPAPAEGSGQPAAFSLDRLTITDGQLAVTDLQSNQPRTVYDHIDLTLEDFAPEKPFSFDLTAHIQGEGTQEIQLKGTGGPMVAGSPAATPLKGTLTLNEVSLEGLLKFLDSKALPQAQGVLSGATDIASDGGNLQAKGKLNLEQARLNGVDIGYPIALDYDLAADIADSLLNITSATIRLGNTPLAIAGTVRAATTPPVMDLRLRSGDVSISEIARLASAFGVAFAPGTNVEGRVNADIQAKGTTTRPVLSGTVGGRDLQISGQGVPQPVQVKSLDLALSPTAIQSNEFSATSGKTTVVGRFALQQYTSESPTIDLALRAPGATLPEIQSIARAYGITSLDQISGEGTMDFDLRARGAMKSLTSADAARALNGTINLDFSPLKIAGFDSVHKLGEIGGFASNLSDQGATEMLKVLGQIVVKNGVAQTNNLQAQLGVGNLAAAGTADLATEALNLKLSAVFTKAFSDKVGATRAGGFMTAALANAAGELVIPAIVTGSFKEPRFAPDLQAVAQMQKQRFIPSLDNPAAAISNVLGVLKGKPKEEAATEGDKPAEEPQQPSPIKGILDLFGGRKTEQPK